MIMEYRKRRREHRGAFAGLFLLLLGGVLFLQNYYPNFHFESYVWPGVLIFIGLLLIFRRRRYDWRDEWRDQWRHEWHQRRHEWRGPTRNYESTSSEDTIDSVTGMGTVKRKVISKNFRGGDVTTIMGYTTIDLTEADIKGTVRMQVTQVMGGTKIIVPGDWEIRSEGNAVFGGFGDKREQSTVTNPEKVLVIDGTSVFGDIQVKTV
jgi:predicted membrane protein